MSDASPPSDVTDAYVPATPRERFAPGTLLAGRYRIVAALGRGGMGEVYRADDLTLGQPVALKFLPVHIAADPERLSRFRQEVAAARKVSHPNVCRVYDITEFESHSFLTMEYIDGEDLSSVLKRLGRVPEEKGIEVARQLCSALAAVHDQGLLHRDLKPANVMLDGRGKVRLADFGLAAAAEDLSVTEVRSGTPLYQAPEQIAGKEVTVRSDLFALGLVLYELFTGKRAFADSKRDSSPSKPSSHVSSLDPAVEQTILRCLEPDPANRPRSTFEVLAALPGGDPLAAAIAAGETPSPKVLINAPVDGTLSRLQAGLLIAFVIAGIVGIAVLNEWTALIRRMPLDRSPRELTRDARATIRRLNLEVPKGDTARGLFEDYPAYFRELDHDHPASWDELRTGEPPLCFFWYRESPALLLSGTPPDVALVAPGRVSITEPAIRLPGEVCALFDLKGRLIELHAIPPRESRPSTVSPPDWGPLLAAAGLDPATLTPDPTPTRIPDTFADARAAWTGTYPDRPDRRVRIEAAALGGRPVYFYIGRGDAPDRCDPAQLDPLAPAPFEAAVSAAIAALLVLTAAVWLVRRNLIGGRADVRGAGRLAVAFAVIHIFLWVVAARHVFAFEAEVIGGFAGAVGRGAVNAALAGVAYLALEPAVRRRWPWRLVAWSRLLDGRWKDPIIGRDVLIGVAAGVAAALTTHLQCLAPAIVGEAQVLNSFPGWSLTNTATWFAFGLLRGTTFFIYFYLLFVLTALTRRQWIGAVIWFGLIFTIYLGTTDRPWLEGPVMAVGLALLLVVMLRYGLLAFLVAGCCRVVLYNPLLTLDAEAWYAASGAVSAAVVLLLAGWAFYTSTGGRLFQSVAARVP